MAEYISDDRCKEDENGGARYCLDCKQVIYMGSKLPEDSYYLDENNYYHHHVCPQPPKETYSHTSTSCFNDHEDEFPPETGFELWGG